MTKELQPINLVKSGFGIGGASLADIGLLSHLRDQGHEVSILTGYTAPEVESEIVAAHLPLHVDERLDHTVHESPATIREIVLGHAASNQGVALFSQALCANEANLGQAAIDVSRVWPSIYRQHDHLAATLEEPYASLESGLLLAVADIVGKRFHDRNSDVTSLTLPPLADLSRFTYSPGETAAMRHNVRESLSIEEGGLVIFSTNTSRRDERHRVHHSHGGCSTEETCQGRGCGCFGRQ